jgi:hypothetical protein
MLVKSTLAVAARWNRRRMYQATEHHMVHERFPRVRDVSKTVVLHLWRGWRLSFFSALIASIS